MPLLYAILNKIIQQKGGLYVLAATAKIGSKYFVHVDVLQAIRSQLEQLPAKQKNYA